MQWLVIEQVFRIELLNHLFDELFGLFRIDLPLVSGNDSIFRVNEHQGRPRSNGIFPPQAHRSVIDYRVGDAITQHCIAYTIRELLPFELWRVDTYYSQLPGKGCFYLAQLRECMHAVDSAQCPEVDDQDMIAEFVDVQWMVAINPIQSLGEIGRSNFSPKL
jgi:hypothetical protein